MVANSDSGCGNADAHDGIDPVAWARLTIIATAASRRDGRGYAEEIARWRDDFPLAGQHRMGVYLMYVLGYQVKLLLENNKPTDEELRQIAEAAQPLVLQVLDRASAAQLEETLRVAFDRPFQDAGVTPAEFLVFAGAILGVQMADPDAELAAIRPRLATWWHRHEDNFRAQGLIG